MHRQDIIDHLILLYKLAQKKDIHFDANCYVWKLGAGIVHKLSDEYITFNADTVSEFCGIAVEIDFNNTEKIQLWKDVTNDL